MHEQVQKKPFKQNQQNEMRVTETVLDCFENEMLTLYKLVVFLQVDNVQTIRYTDTLARYQNISKVPGIKKINK